MAFRSKKTSSAALLGSADKQIAGLEGTLTMAHDAADAEHLASSDAASRLLAEAAAATERKNRAAALRSALPTGNVAVSV